MEQEKTFYVNGVPTPRTQEALVNAGINEKDAALAIEFLQKAEARNNENVVEALPWARYAPNGYEVSSHGDRRFSALNARLKDGRTIEEAYQLDVKGYRSQSNNWRAGKGKPPISPISKEELYQKYLSLWRQWGKENPVLLMTLKEKAAGKTLTDKFATTPITQARALADLLKEIQPMSEKEIQSIVESEKPIVAKAKEVMSRNTPSDAVDVLTRCYKGRPENVIEAKRWATNLVKATLRREIQLEGHSR